MAAMMAMLIGFIGLGLAMLFGVAALFKVSATQLTQFLPVVIGLPGGMLSIWKVLTAAKAPSGTSRD